MQNTLKRLVSQAAVDYLLDHVPQHAVIGIGTGSTVNCFIDTLAALPIFKHRYRGVVSSSHASTAQLKAQGINVFDVNDIDCLPVYIDSTDEIDGHGHMIKGGGGALTGEKIIAMVTEIFVCIADISKRVDQLGAFALPIEILPMARAALSRKFTALGGVPMLRMTSTGYPYLTDYGNQMIDVKGLKITDPVALEAEINNWPGVVTVGLFAKRKADLALFGTEQGVETVSYPLYSQATLIR